MQTLTDTFLCLTVYGQLKIFPVYATYMRHDNFETPEDKVNHFLAGLQ